MNDLLSGSWRTDPTPDNNGGYQQLHGDSDLDNFFEDAAAIKAELNEVERLRRRLHDPNESLNALTSADVASALRQAKQIKARLASLDRRHYRSDADRARRNVVAGLRTKVKEAMDDFAGIRRTLSGAEEDEVEGSLAELQVVFAEMAALVAEQGEDLNDIEAHVVGAASVLHGATQELRTAREERKSYRRKWFCLGTVGVAVIIVLVVGVVVIVVVNQK